ncbi:MAG: TIGR02328 family protein [Desulfotomaculaceae bacterium]|nr:TIGR02328 family protein [Desulfotomaculaceae bacterium]
MRLWAEQLIVHLDRPRLLGQHRECCALRGLGWGRKHSTVDYVFVHSPLKLYRYHMLVVKEMQRRGYNVNEEWCHWRYRGQRCEAWPIEIFEDDSRLGNVIYPEHNETYLQECLQNLRGKGLNLIK